jgi:hypothetical protein
MWGRYPPIDTSPQFGDPDVIWTRNLLIVRRQQQQTVHHRTTLLPALDIRPGKQHNWRQQRRPTSLQLPAAPSSPTTQVSTGSWTTGFALCVFPRKLIQQRRSWLTTTPAWLMVPPILTHGWLLLSLNLGLRRDYTARNPSSQDTDDELPTLMA